MILQVLILAKSYAQERGFALSTVGKLAADRGAFFTALDNGTASATVSKLERVTQWFSDNWPEDLDWPDGIDRPKPTKTHTKGAA